jgi:hypothetical protein
VFDEQLRKTRTFEQAFAAAVPVIRQREQEAGKPTASPTRRFRWARGSGRCCARSSSGWRVRRGP